MSAYYKNAICIADKSALKLKADWFYDQNIIPFFNIEHCQGKSTCKPLAEVKKFIAKQTFFLATQNTEFVPDIFYDKNFGDLDKSIFNFNTSDYFPLITGAKPLFYGPLKPSEDDDMVQMLEVTMRVN